MRPRSAASVNAKRRRAGDVGGMSLVLDAGALVALERSDRDTVALVKRELLAGRVPVTHDGVVTLAAAAGCHIDIVPV